MEILAVFPEGKYGLIASGIRNGRHVYKQRMVRRRYFASNQRDRNPRLVCFDLQSSSVHLQYLPDAVLLAGRGIAPRPF